MAVHICSALDCIEEKSMPLIRSKQHTAEARLITMGRVRGYANDVAVVDCSECRMTREHSRADSGVRRTLKFMVAHTMACVLCSANE